MILAQLGLGVGGSQDVVSGVLTIELTHNILHQAAAIELAPLAEKAPLCDPSTPPPAQTRPLSAPRARRVPSKGL